MNLHEFLKTDAPSENFIDPLLEDVHESARLAAAHPGNQFWRRTYIRSIFAFIEGANNYMKQMCYSYHEREIRPMYHMFRVLKIPSPSPLFAQVQSEAALLLLLDKAMTVTSNGECQVKEAFSPMDRSIRLMFEMSKQVFQTNFIPNYGTSGWMDLKQSVIVRNRLTHPKIANDLDVTEEEANACQRGCQWFINTLAEAGNKQVAVIRHYRSGIEEFVNGLPMEKIQALNAATANSSKSAK